jgi:UDP-N-acetylglucosamine 2-epimerase
VRKDENFDCTWRTPQFIKAAPVSRALGEAGHTEVIVHTGQNYDYKMSQVFFDELSIAETNVNLEVGSGSHQTGIIPRESFTLYSEV